ncbi:MAG TPA: NAD(P)-dependent alcohol dehydrogenase [Candidatus Dormibacteraeota bacterium]|nr:NAD(P)-dependent alcohol dehydrogenase [Candidatus Dormibacteraeota bacterium]HEX2679873.1 NAD(P)-dependent alcohol dehydrogenase [Candidatus Dormibacteraeota bacterium]
MKAILQEAYGVEHLRLQEVEKPTPGDGDLLLRVRAAGVNPLDWHYALGNPLVARLGMGLSRPKDQARGVDVAGVVEATGEEVFGCCAGAFAEYASAPADHFVPKPSNMTFEEAAAVPVAAITALQGLRDKGKLRPGQSVLFNGASGGVGTYGVQIAKALGAAHVTGVCSTRNVELVRSLGADEVVDYTREDFTKRTARYDLIFDNAGSQPIGALRRTLKPGGILVYNSGASMPRVMTAMILGRMGRNVFSFLTNVKHDDLVFMASLIEAGQVRSVIDRTFTLAETAAAIAYVHAGHARGKVVVTV